MKNFQCKNVMRKKNCTQVPDQFSDDEMDQIKHYGQALGGSPTPFDEEVERHLRKIAAGKKRIKAALTGKSDQRGPTGEGQVRAQQRDGDAAGG
jgi:hypothetical protein